MARKTKAQLKKEKDTEIRRWITIVILLALVVIGLMRSGVVGLFLYRAQRYLFGNIFYIVLGLIVVLLLIEVFNRTKEEDGTNPVPFILIDCVILMICTYISTQETGLQVFLSFINNTTSYFMEGAEAINAGGGLFGSLLYAIFSMLLGRAGVIIAIIVCIVIASLLLVSLEVYKNAFFAVVAFFKVPESEEEVIEPEEVEEKEPKNFWVMMEEHKEKKEVKKAKLVPIEADDPKEEEGPELDIVPKYDENDVEEERQPHITKLINIKADNDTQEIPVVSIPGKTLSDAKSVFINVDDLQDDYAEEEIEDTLELDLNEDPILEEIEEDSTKQEDEVDTNNASKNKPTTKKADPVLKSKKPYKIPTQRIIYSMLDPISNQSVQHENEAAAKEKGELLINILCNFDIEAQLIDTHIGPSVTQFEIKPNASVKVSKILGLADNIKMALAAKDVRIEAPIPGRNAVGIEIPNVKSTPVKLREIINDISQNDKKQQLLFFVGKDLLGQTVTCRLDKMPHLLIAGATGSGKSVMMNSIITSFLLRTDPEDVKLLLIDPKKVEFTPYANIPHLIGPVINDPNQANSALNAVVSIMDERYNIFAAAGVRNIQVFNEKVQQQNGKPNEDGTPAPKKMPYIVVIIDELADLMAVAGKDVEQSIQRLTQLARAAGIHLIIATQRPSVDVITGIIKANIPSRIAFAVSSNTDSRTILDHAGAERLLGNGDMLYMPIGSSSAMRTQGVFVTDEEVAKITKYVSQWSPTYNEKFLMLDDNIIGNGPGGVITVNQDPMFKEAKLYVAQAQKASTSLLQRRFGIGYNRAARMVDAMEEAGYIGPAQGSKPREVYIKPEDVESEDGDF